MELHLSRDSTTTVVLSCAPKQAATGSANTLVEATPLYHIYSPGTFTRRTTFISRIDPTSALKLEHKFKSSDKKDIKERAAYLDGGVEEFARIHWHTLSSAKLVYNMQIIDLDRFMTGSDLIGSARMFTGPDGLSYSWHLGQMMSHLTLNATGSDGSSKEVAKFYPQTNLRSSNAKPYLDVHPEGLHMLDLIVITWVYIETRRRELEKRRPAPI
ncbi:hypothetical protein EIP91_009491 [Steccherinum ochraceum]|uniref:DUF6593 domain-containing protein n=1 Tax=Steccherinum ochraceum TaxID=92696 RepID=A0A4R0R3V1_9APHY|nr:hypothetical protein EIP91_009491 [Steccherinum ochraceum]